MTALVEKWLPPVLRDLSLQAATTTRFMMWRDKHLLSNNIALRKTGTGKRAFVLATGPSIGQEDLTVLAGEDCFSLSNFFLHDEIYTIKPLFHFFAPYHPPLILNDYVAWLRAADQKLPRETKIFLGHAARKLVKDHDLFPEREVFYLYLARYPDMRRIDLVKPVLSPPTGPLMVLPVLLYMGYSKIYLLGCDCTTLRDYKKKITHFYAPQEDLRRNSSDSKSWGGIIESLTAEVRMFETYLFYQYLMTQKQVELVNLSKDSWLDFLPCSSLEKTVMVHQ